MNSILSYTAKAKILQILSNSPDECVVLETVGSRLNLSFSDRFKLLKSIENSIMISVVPLVYADAFTTSKLPDGAVDFDYKTQDFILTV